MLSDREQRGIIIAAKCKIARTEQGYVVPSQAGSDRYVVNLAGEKPHCSCPDHAIRGGDCKHICAVRYTIDRE